MDAMMMIPAQAAPKAALPGGGSSRDTGKSRESFADYMDKKLDGLASRKNLLGVKPKMQASAKPDGAARQSADSDAAKTAEDIDMEDAQNMAALLAQFLQDMQAMAKDSEKKPGEWGFTLPDNNILQQLAADAGMEKNKLAALLQQSEAQNGVFDLRNFLTTLTRHFEERGKDVAVTVPETDLPFLETLLSKLGVPVEQVVDVADKGATGDGKLDLAAFLEGLRAVKDNNQPIALTDLDKAQLQDILAKAGVSEALQNRLLPQQDTGTPFSLARLREMLQQGIANVKESRPKLDLPAFLNDLQQVFTEAKFNDQNVGWSPAVQAAVTSAYEELLKSVDLAKIQVKIAQGPGKPQTMTVEDDGTVDLHGLADADASAEGQISASVADGNAENGEMGAGQERFPASSESAPAGMSQESHAAAAAAAGRHTGSAQQMAVTPGREAAPAPQMPPGLAQQTFHNISNGVLNGLKNNEHHLVLRLYPRELGEVKVEMTVRDQNVTLSFAMENHRVKETLESNMQQFQDNLARQGFNLQGCEVSVNQQQDDANGAWQFFEQARQQGKGRVVRETLADLPAEAMYIRPVNDSVREGGISLFI